MILSLQHFLIVCPFVFFAGFVDAVAGGGGLISLPAYMLSGVPVHSAIATNKLSSGMGTAVSTRAFAKNGYIPWKQAGFCAGCALVGSAIGANLALVVSDVIFKRILLIALPLTGIYVLRKKSFVSNKAPYTEKKTILISMVIALVIGAYDGFYGPGTSTFLLLLLTALAHMDLFYAGGVTKVINLTTNVTSLTVYLLNGKVLIPLGLTAGLFSICGNYLGARYFKKSGSRAVRPLIVVVLMIFFVQLAHELWVK